MSGPNYVAVKCGTSDTRKIYMWYKKCSFLIIYTSYNNLVMMMRMINCFCGMVDQRKAFSLTSSRNQCQRS